MWNIPVLKAGLVLLEVFKVFQSESIYCLGEKKAVVVLDAETPAESSVQYPSRPSEFLSFDIALKSGFYAKPP